MKSPCEFGLQAVKHSARVAAGLALFAALGVIAQAQTAPATGGSTSAAPAQAAPAAQNSPAVQPPSTGPTATAAKPADTKPAGDGKLDLARAQQIAGQVCASCHGAEGISAAPVNPHLAGQHAQYLTVQLDHFKTGIRKNPVMNAMAAQLTPDEMRALGVYYADKKPKPGAAKDKALAELGQKIYRGGNAKAGLAPCASCHAPNGVGIPVQYPRLAGQYSDYVYAQLQGFVKGDRGGEMKTPQGKIVEDAQGKVMAGIASKMTDREMRAVAEYVSGLR